jgi:chromate transport protein ChrA
METIILGTLCYLLLGSIVATKQYNAFKKSDKWSDSETIIFLTIIAFLSSPLWITIVFIRFGFFEEWIR